MAAGASILLVGDDREELCALAAVLEPIDAACVLATSSAAALAIAREHDLAAVVMDVELADRDGFATAAEMRAEPRCAHTPIVFVTDRRFQSTLIAHAYTLGALDYVLRPYEPALLRAKLATLVALQRKDDALRASEGRFRIAFEHAPIGIAILDPQGRWLDVNARLGQMLGRPPEDLLENPPFGLGHLTDADDDRDLFTALAADSTVTVERRLFCTSASTLWTAIHVALVRDQNGEPLHLICQVEDVSERKAAEESLNKRIAYLAYHDELTGLPNRSMFREHLDLALARGARHGESIAILNLDLNRFKLVNDSLGHAAGDQLLAEAAARLAGAVRASDLVARMGGDEFVVLLADIEPGNERAVAERVAGAIHATLERPFTIAGTDCQIGTSIGIAVFPHDPSGIVQPDPEALLREADTAMYEAKQSGAGSVLYTEPQLDRLVGAAAPR